MECPLYKFKSESMQLPLNRQNISKKVVVGTMLGIVCNKRRVRNFCINGLFLEMRNNV